MHDLAAAVDALMPALQADLEALIRIPSISASSYDAARVRESAEATADLMRAAGLDGVRILEHGEAQIFKPFDRFAQNEKNRGKTIDENAALALTTFL